MLLDILLALREKTDSVIVAVSRGKDSLALLDLAVKHFSRVECFSMYLVPGLSFIESYLGYLERRYKVAIDRVPHWWLSQAFRHATYRPLTRTCPRVTIRDVQAAQRERTSIEWIVSGEKMCDSLQRRGMLHSLGGIDPKARVGYPLARWTDRQVYAHLKRYQIMLPVDYRLLGRSFSSTLDGRTMSLLKQHFPEDYAKIEEAFPFVGASILRHEIQHARDASSAGTEAASVAEVPGGARKAEPDHPAPAQPASDRPAREKAAARKPRP